MSGMPRIQAAGRADERPRERPRAVFVRHPLGCGDGPADEQRGNGHTEEHLGAEQQAERRSRSACHRREREPCRAGDDRPPQRQAAGEGAEAIAAAPAATPEAVRSWPAVAVETSRSFATFDSTGVRTISPAWAANRDRKSETATAVCGRPQLSVVVAFEAIQRWSPLLLGEGMWVPRHCGCGHPHHASD
jgi:hypothetical protein